MARSLLTGEFKARMTARFKGKLLPGTLRREVPGAGVDAYGDPNAGTIQIFSFEGMRQTYDARFRAQAGIPDTDVGIFLLLGLVSPETEPRPGDQVSIDDQWYQVRHIDEIDPASVSMLLQCFEIADPAP